MLKIYPTFIIYTKSNVQGNISVLEIDGHTIIQNSEVLCQFCDATYGIAIKGTIKGKTYGLSRLLVILQ